MPVLDDLLDSYKKVGQRGRNDDDIYDRYSHRWTVILLGVFVIAVTSQQFVGTPIECIPPPDFGGQQKEYVENYCWIHRTYSVDDKTALTRSFVRGGNGSRTTPYYIWTPFICIAAALFMYLPAWLWHVVGHRAAFDIPAMINQLAKMDLTNTDDRKKNLIVMAKHYEKVEKYARSHVRITDNLFKRFMSLCMFFAGGGVLTGIYFLIKMCYLINAVGQFFLMNYYLQIDYWSYGQNVLYGIITGRGWMENKVYFPRIVYCDFTIRVLGDNNLKYTVQCTLPINLYNERIFAFYWFWLLFLTCATFYGIIIWLVHMSYRSRRSFLKRHLRLNLDLDVTNQEKRLFNTFADRYLGGDGILFLRLIAKNTNPVIAGELLGAMWDRFIAAENAIEIIAVKNIKKKSPDSDMYLNGGGHIHTLPFKRD